MTAQLSRNGAGEIVYMSKCAGACENAGHTFGVSKVNLSEECWNHKMQGVGHRLSVAAPVSPVKSRFIVSRSYRWGKCTQGQRAQENHAGLNGTLVKWFWHWAT